VSSGHSCSLEHAVDVAGQVALEAADRFADALALAGLAFDVGDRRCMALSAADDDRVQGAVELAVSVWVEPMADGLAGAGGDRGGCCEAGEGGLVADAAWVGPGDQGLGGGDGSDALLVEQRLRRACAGRSRCRAPPRLFAGPGGRRQGGKSKRARVSERSSLRNGSGQVTRSARSWQRHGFLAASAPSRATISARSASRLPPARGVAGFAWARTLRAARSASRASVLAWEQPLSLRPPELEHPLAPAG
jgi:hypothetical protein